MHRNSKLKPSRIHFKDASSLIVSFFSKMYSLLNLFKHPFIQSFVHTFTHSHIYPSFIHLSVLITHSHLLYGTLLTALLPLTKHNGYFNLFEKCKLF